MEDNDFGKQNDIKKQPEHHEDGVDGVEKDPDVFEEFPFDAEKIYIEMRVVPMMRLIERLQNGTLSVPEIQRNSDLWTRDKQSRLIESLMLRIPLPLFYVAADADENWKIIDGLQRVSSIRNFMIDNHKFEKLEFLTQFNSKTIDDLSGKDSKYLNRVKDTQFQFAVISATTPTEVQRAIFKRLNTGGLSLTFQEIRHALYYEKKSSNFLKELVNSEEFKNATGTSIDDSRMAAQEVVLRFIAFLIREKAYIRDDMMDTFLSETMILMNIMPDCSEAKARKYSYRSQDKISLECKHSDFDTIRQKFLLAMTRASKLFGDHAFRKSMGTRIKRTPINKALFETISVILAEISDDHFSFLDSNKNKVLERIEAYFKNNELELSNLISRDSQKVTAVRERFKLFKKLLTWSLE